MIQFNGMVFDAEAVKQLLDLGTEGAGGLGEDHDLVVLDVLLHLLHGGPGHRSHRYAAAVKLTFSVGF